MNARIVCIVESKIVARTGARFVQAVQGQSDVMSLTVAPTGSVRFSRSFGVISRPEGEDYRAMLAVAQIL